MRAMWNEVKIAESDDIVVFEGTRYFPAQTISSGYVIKTERVFHCPKRGYGAYVDLYVGKNQKKDAGVYFAHPYPEAAAIMGRVCFLYGIEIVN